MQKVDIRTVAAYCGVAISTVSRALNNRPDVSPSTREKVLAAAQKLGYVPNSSARNLARTGADSVVIVVRGKGNPFFGRIVSCAEKRIREKGCSTVIRSIDAEEDEMRAAAVLVAEHKALGVLLLGGRTDYSEEDARMLGVPFVCVAYSNLCGTLDRKAYASVTIDDAAEAERAVRHLVRNGHRRIAALLAVQGDRSIGDLRRTGYEAGLKRAGLAVDEGLMEYGGSFAIEDAYDAAIRLFDRRRDFTALFAVTDYYAIAAIRASADRGIRVPQDLSVMGMDGLPFTKYTLPELTTLEQPADRLGEEGAQLLFSMLRSGGGRHLVLPSRLRKGETVRKIEQRERGAAIICG